MKTSQSEAAPFRTLDWGKTDISKYPNMVVPAPGPQSKAWHDRCTKYFKGLSGQVKLFPVAFESGEGCVLRDVDGNDYIDFSSGIYVTTLGPLPSEDQRGGCRSTPAQLMNAHDFTTPIKTAAGGEAGRDPAGRPERVPVLRLAARRRSRPGMRVCARPPGKQRDDLLLLRLPRQDLRRGLAGADPLARLRPRCARRASTWCRGPTPTARCGRRPTARSTPTSTSTFYDEYIDKATVGDVAGFVLEPIQGWGGSVMPPDDFFPKLRKFCDERRILLMADEVLTSWGRTGKWLCMEHWGVVPDVVTIGKGFGNGFPVTCVAVREPYKEIVRDDLGLEQLRRQPDGLRGGAGLASR